MVIIIPNSKIDNNKNDIEKINAINYLDIELNKIYEIELNDKKEF